MPKRADIKSILIIGAGPIVIGQACEFDYSGTQATQALKDTFYPKDLSPMEEAGKEIAFRPPSWVFGVVWPVLLLLLGYSWTLRPKLTNYYLIFD